MIRAIRVRVLGLVLLCAIALIWPPGAGAQQTQWRADYFPNTAFTDQNGRTVHFYDDVLHDKVVAINFVYTTCVTVCPLDIAQMRRVQEILGDRVGRDIFFYSISINPERDTPEALRRTMRTYDVAPGWTFLTGSRADVDELQRRFGLNVADPNNLGGHEATVVMGNEATGQWIRRSAFESPQNIANILASTLHNHATPVPGSGPLQSYAVAGRITDTSRGSYLFRTRCQSCHTIGRGDRLGPDLRGVAASRDPAWLSRWIREPNLMIDEHDPVALALLARYRNLQMPNLSLGETDAAAIIEFMRNEDAQEHAAGAPAVNRRSNL